MHQFLKSFVWLEPVVELLRLGIFTAFIALLIGQRLARSEDERRQRAQLVIWFVVIVTSLVGITQIDAWPFTNWALVHGLRSPVMHSWDLEGVDASGRVWTIDKAVLQPMAAEEIAAPLGMVPLLDTEGRNNVARWLYERAENERARVARGGRFPPNDFLLGRLSAPYHFEARRRWRSAVDVPPRPFASVRLVFTTWNIDERDQREERAIERRVIAEYPPHD